MIALKSARQLAPSFHRCRAWRASSRASSQGRRGGEGEKRKEEGRGKERGERE